MDEITQEQIIESIQNNPELISGLMPVIQESEVVKNLITNKSNAIYQSRIDDEVKSIHSRYDADMLEVLNERPGQIEGQKQKTYEKIKSIYSELKGFRDKKNSLDKDEVVQSLRDKIAQLETDGGSSHVQEQFDQAKIQWQNQQTVFENQLDELRSDKINFLKQGPINEALAQIKFTKETPESVRKMVLNSAKKLLINESEIRKGELVFLNKDGKVDLNSKYEPKTAVERVMELEAVKDISFKDDIQKGGGADEKIKGGLITTSVEGKDVKKLNIPTGSFKSKSEFIQVAEKAMTDAGLTIRDKEWTILKNQAYQDFNVKDLPAKV